MKAILAVGAFVAAMQFSAVAQEEFRAMDGRALVGTTLTLDKEIGYNQLTVGIRIPFLGGSMDNGGDKWTDWFSSTGVGFGMDGTRLWSVSSKVAVGIYTSLSVDSFGGKSQTVDIGGGPVEESMDDLLIFRWLVGGRVRETFGKFFMDQSLGFGFAVFSATGATANGVSVGVIDSSTVFAFDMSFRFGVVVSRVVDLGMSLTYYYNGAPSVDSDIAAVAPGLKLDSQSNVVLGFFVNINF